MIIQTEVLVDLDLPVSKGFKMCNDKKIVLASQSPRRKELLARVISDFEIIVDNSEEVVKDGLSPEETVKELALQKAMNVSDKIDYDALVIGADTIVSIDGQIFGKPADQEDAARMLRCLSERENIVCTGYAVVDTKSGKAVCGVERTSVFFRKLSDDEIERYIKTGEPMDKAGAYGMQELGGLFIRGIEGDYFNVVGLPLCALAQMLKRDFNYTVL